MSRNYGGSMVANLFVKFGADTTEYQKKMRASVTRMLFAAESLTQAGRIMSTAITAPMIAVGVASLKTAMQFESAMTRMVSLVGMPAETIARWGPAVQHMAGIVGKSAKELAEALFFITSNGIRTDEALRVLEATAKASAVGMGETKDIAIAATSALNAYGAGALTANESVAVLIGTVREGNLEAAELPAALSKLLPVAAAMGIEFHEAGAGIAAMSRSGTSARLAAFGLRAIMMGILAPTKSAAAAMESVELSSAKLKETLAGPTGLRDALFQIKDATERSDVTLKDILPNQRAFTAALQLLGKNSQDYVDISKSMAKVVGEDVNDSFKKGAHTMERTYNQAMGNLSSAAIDIGNNLAPLIDTFAKLTRKISATASAYKDLDDTQKGVIDSLAYAVAAFGPLLYVLGSLSRITARGMGLSILFGAGWAKNAAGFGMAATKTGLLGTSVTALGGALIPATAAIVGTYLASFKLSEMLDEAFGTTKALNEEFGRFGTTARTIADRWRRHGDEMERATDQSTSLARKIGELGLANELMDARMAGNTARMAELVLLIDEKANAYNRATAAVIDNTTAEDNQAAAVKAAGEELAAEEEARLEALRKTHNLMTSDEVTAKMQEITGHYKDHIEAGVHELEVNDRMKDDWLEMLRLAELYGIATTKAFKDIGQSMFETGDITQNELWKLWAYHIPVAIKKIPGVVNEAMIKIEKEGGIAKSLTGGLTKGFTDSHTAMDSFNTRLAGGISTAYREGLTDFGDTILVTINESVERMGPIEIEVLPNLDAFMNIYEDIKNGNIPDTSG